MATCKQGIDGPCGINPAAPATPGLTTADVNIYREVDMGGQKVINGIDVDFWCYFDPNGEGDLSWPSPAMRVTQGQIVHTHLRTSHEHTIHHHGIQPSSFNDGVGHYSFDVVGDYIYQWRPVQAGTYMYHCHTNTVLHVEMGMYGGLIVDPPSGPGTAFEGGPTYDVEAVWAADEVDTAWRCHNQHAALCGGDAGLNVLNPDLFIISGVGSDDTETHPAVAVNALKGENILIRYIHAGYFPHRVIFENVGNSGLGDVNVIAEDGQPLAVPETLPVQAGRASTIITPGGRVDFYVTPKAKGNYRVTIEYLHWIKGNVVGTTSTFINVG